MTKSDATRRRRLEVAIATDKDREAIYHLRHDVFASEIGQYEEQPSRILRDQVDDFNVYIKVSEGEDLRGFVSITPPTSPSYAFEKYLDRGQLTFDCDASLYEIRLLTVENNSRNSQVAGLLMYATFRWIEAHGGTRIICMGRNEVLRLYERFGLRRVGKTVQSGAVTYELLTDTIDSAREVILGKSSLLRRLARGTDWKIGVPFLTPAGSYHGGAFFDAIGTDFHDLSRSDQVINGDVLDAWFPPSPSVLQVLTKYLPWILRTSPPTSCDGMVKAIARIRGVDSVSILPGAGSSSLIYLGLRHWLTPASKVLLLDPTYGEYAHVLQHVVGCHIDRFELSRSEGYIVDTQRLRESLLRGYDMAIIVNPNSPTGRHIERTDLESVLADAPKKTRIWIDETYVEYAGPDQSLERFALRTENVVVCKSLSKAYALSGVRAAYLCASPHLLEGLRSLTPPWAVSLPGQIAAVFSLEDRPYYEERYKETRALRADLARHLVEVGIEEVVPGCANFLLLHLPMQGPTAASFVASCRERSLFLRDATGMGSSLGNRAVRIAVKDRPTNAKMVEIIASVLHEPAG